MVSTVYEEWGLLLESIRLGLQLGVLYDCLKIIRMILRHSALLRDLEDALYWVISTLLILELQLEDGQGVFRGFSIGAVFLTMIIYHKLLSQLWIPHLERGIERLKNPLTKIKKMLRIKIRKQIIGLVFNGREHDKEESSGSEKKTKPPGDDTGYDGGTGYDAGGGSK